MNSHPAFNAVLAVHEKARALMEALKEDMLTAYRELNQTPSTDPLRSYRMRNFIKCAFSLVEGSCFGLRSFCADANNLPGIDHLDSDELDYILEKQKWIKRDDVVKDSFKFFARVMNFHFILDCDKPGWPALTRSWLVRDRLAHPKKVED